MVSATALSELSARWMPGGSVRKGLTPDLLQPDSPDLGTIATMGIRSRADIKNILRDAVRRLIDHLDRLEGDPDFEPDAPEQDDDFEVTVD